MKIYLVQSGGSLDGADGYSYGLLKGGHKRLLVSYVDYRNAGRTTVHTGGKPATRRRLAKRAKK